MTSHCDVWITASDHQLLIDHLFQEDEDEHGAVFRAGVVETDRGLRLIINQVIPALDGQDYVAGEFGHRALTPTFIHRQIIGCRDQRLAYLAVHNHGCEDKVQFSRVDMASHERGYPALRDIGRGIPVGALVHGRHSVQADVWLAAGGFEEPDRVMASFVLLFEGWWERAMVGQPGFFDFDDRLRRLSDLGDQLEAFAAAVDFELFRPVLDAALAYADGAKGGRPPLDPVLMFKVLIIQAANGLSDERAEYLINDRLSFMRFLGLSLGDRVPDARTIWLFRERLTRAVIEGRPAIEVLFARFDATLREAGYIAMSGQIVDATLVAAPRQRNTAAEKAEIKAGGIPAEWKSRPAKLRHKDRDARWTVKFTKAKPDQDGHVPATDLAVPVFGYQNHASIDRAFGLIRTWRVTDAAAYEGRLLREGLLDKSNTAGLVWADTAYRSKANEQFMAENGFVSRVHRKKPPGKPMPVRTARANGTKSKVRARIEHVFAEQKSRMGLFIRTVGIARARTKIGVVNLVYNLKRLIVLERWAAIAAV